MVIQEMFTARLAMKKMAMKAIVRVSEEILIL